MPQQPAAQVFVRAAVGVVAVVLLWGLAAGIVQDPLFLPSLASVIRKTIELCGTDKFQADIRASGAAFFRGFASAAIVGILFGLLFRLEPVRILLGGVVSVLAAIPFVALAPVVILWLGLGDAAKSLTVFLVAVFPLMKAVADGVSAGEPARTDGSSASEPASGGRSRTAHAIVSALRQGVGFGVIGLVVSEMVASNAGLGYAIVNAMAMFDTTAMLAAVVTLAVPTIIAVTVLEAVEAELANRSAA